MDLKGKLTRRDMLKLSGSASRCQPSWVAGCGSSSSGGGGSGSSGSKTLTLGYIGWTENIAVANLTMVVMGDDLGYDVQMKGPPISALCSRVSPPATSHAFQDVWMPNNQSYLDKPQIEPQVEVLDPGSRGRRSTASRCSATWRA